MFSKEPPPFSDIACCLSHRNTTFDVSGQFIFATIRWIIENNKKKDSRDGSALPLSSNADVNDCLKLTAVGHQRIEWAKRGECRHLAPHAWFHRKPTVKTVVTYTSLHVIWYISANQLWAQSLPGSSGIPYALLLQYLLKETNWHLSPTVLSPSVQPPTSLGTVELLCGFISFVPSFDFTSECAEKNQ